MKTIRTKDETGQPVRGWSFRTAKCTQVGVFHGEELPARRITGWEIVAPDGYARFCEGNWQQFVPFANMVLENHGLKGVLS